MKDKGEVIVHWIGKENQIADCLTKKGASCTNLPIILPHGKLFKTETKIHHLYTCILYTYSASKKNYHKHHKQTHNQLKRKKKKKKKEGKCEIKLYIPM